MRPHDLTLKGDHRIALQAAIVSWLQQTFPTSS